MELEDESSDGGGGVATALPGRRPSALSASLWQLAAAEGAAAAAGTPPGLTVFGLPCYLYPPSTPLLPFFLRSKR